MIGRAVLICNIEGARARGVLPIFRRFTTTLDPNALSTETKTDLANKLTKMNLRLEKSVLVE